MCKQKYYIAIDEYGRKKFINNLNGLRNRQWQRQFLRK